MLLKSKILKIKTKIVFRIYKKTTKFFILFQIMTMMDFWAKINRPYLSQYPEHFFKYSKNQRIKVFRILFWVQWSAKMNSSKIILSAQIKNMTLVIAKNNYQKT